MMCLWGTEPIKQEKTSEMKFKSLVFSKALMKRISRQKMLFSNKDLVAYGAKLRIQFFEQVGIGEFRKAVLGHIFTAIQV